MRDLYFIDNPGNKVANIPGTGEVELMQLINSAKDSNILANYLNCKDSSGNSSIMIAGLQDESILCKWLEAFELPKAITTNKNKGIGLLSHTGTYIHKGQYETGYKLPENVNKWLQVEETGQYIWLK